MAEVDESIRVTDFIDLTRNLELNKQEQKVLKKFQIFHERKQKKQQERRAKEERALKLQLAKEERQRKNLEISLERQRVKEEEQRVKRDRALALQQAKEQKQKEIERDRKRKLEEKQNIKNEKCLKLEHKKIVLTQREIISETIKMSNGEFGGQLPVLPTSRNALVSNFNWLPENLRTKLGSCKFSLPIILCKDSNIFYFERNRNMNKQNLFVTIRGDFERIHYYCSVIVHGLILMFAILQQRENVIFVIDRKIDKVLFENDLLLAKYIQSRAMIKNL